MPHMNPGMANSQGAAAASSSHSLSAKCMNLGVEGCHGWGDALNRALLPGAEGRWAVVSSLCGLPCKRGTQSLFF